ncbi:MAG: phosphopantothenoylcysteine synthetase/decarboxylase [Bacteriovoracaceae bacterium]|nr:phosphopantothenoylcysteine synthetase/decarboxylase [Bacteriovoracaceae bacterium]
MKDDRDVDIKGAHLAGKMIDLIVAGGIASIETPKLIRELRRYGANVRVFMTKSATQFVSPLVFEWASKNPVVTDLTGLAEHITHADGVLIAPATLDFISKIAVGISDSAAATLVQSAINRIPVLFAPSMHLSLQGNPAYAAHLNSLSKINRVTILSAAEDEGKAKMLGFEEITARVCHELSTSSLSKIPILISLGPTRSYVDVMRYLSNRSTGKLGLAIADDLYRRGAKVFTVCGAIQKSVPHYLNPVFAETNKEMEASFLAIVEKEKPRVGIFSAAVLDFDIVNPRSGKSSSKESIELKLKPSAKLIEATSWPKNMIRVGFKLESGLSIEELKERAKKWAQLNHCELLVANRLEDVGEEAHKAYLFSAKDNSFTNASNKVEIADQISKALEKSF